MAKDCGVTRSVADRPEADSRQDGSRPPLGAVPNKRSQESKLDQRWMPGAGGDGSGVVKVWKSQTRADMDPIALRRTYRCGDGASPIILLTRGAPGTPVDIFSR